MPHWKLRFGDSKQGMKQGVEETAGVLSRSEIRGFGENEPEPQTGRNPGLKKVLVIRRQGRIFAPLFHGIVWRLTRDHDIVHMAFAQASAADANETSPLQKFGNGRATAIAHT